MSRGFLSIRVHDSGFSPTCPGALAESDFTLCPWCSLLGPNNCASLSLPCHPHARLSPEWRLPTSALALSVPGPSGSLVCPGASALSGSLWHLVNVLSTCSQWSLPSIGKPPQGQALGIMLSSTESSVRHIFKMLGGPPLLEISSAMSPRPLLHSSPAVMEGTHAPAPAAALTLQRHSSPATGPRTWETSLIGQ